MNRFRRELLSLQLLVYLDDIILLSTTFESHVKELKLTFSKLREYSLKANRSKTYFCRIKVKYLGHIISCNGIETDLEKVRAIVDRPVPKNKKHVLSFIQTCSWYRRFIEHISAITKPLTDLTKKKQPFQWTEKEQEVYHQLCQALKKTPVLSPADSSKPYTIKTDASNYAIGAVLVQGEKKDEHPVEYASRLLTKAEPNYSTTERGFSSNMGSK